VPYSFISPKFAVKNCDYVIYNITAKNYFYSIVIEALNKKIYFRLNL